MRLMATTLLMWACAAGALAADPAAMTAVAPGIWRVTLGTPESAVPTSLREFEPRGDGLSALPAAEAAPITAGDIRFKATPRGSVISLPMEKGEDIFGFGLQLTGSAKQTGMKRTIRVNSDPRMATGDSHAPVPFYVSTRGYGVYVDTARYATFYAGTHEAPRHPGQPGPTGKNMLIEVPAAQGVDLYVFAGPSLQQAVQRYVLFSGGGCMPPLWGMGVLYRAKGDSTAEEVLALAREFRARRIPCDAIGLEPGWHTHAYSCSYAWNKKHFPDPDGFIAALTALGYRVNLWEHVFVHPSAPIHEALLPYAGDRGVWGGLVPDLTVPEARAIFAGYHDSALVAKGIDAFKLDECDNSDYNGTPWSFPEHTAFPSGKDGEQMHSLIGVQYQRTLYDIFRHRNQRTMGQVRSSQALAAPYPFALYSDLYDHREYVRGVVTAGFGGLLWSPEVRDAASVEDLIRRIQTVAFSPYACVDAWYIKNPPWKQIETEKNNRGEFLPEWEQVEARCRNVLEARMRLVPYLYAAFMIGYRNEGLPPFRGLMADYPGDPAAFVDDEYMMGDALLVAPLFAREASRKIYLPKGTWFDFWTREKIAGGQSIEVPASRETIPVYVKEGCILPLAEPADHITPETIFKITAVAFGKNCAPRVLFEDDGETFDAEKGRFNRVTLQYTAENGPKMERQGDFPAVRYEISGWEHVE